MLFSQRRSLASCTARAAATVRALTLDRLLYLGALVTVAQGTVVTALYAWAGDKSIYRHRMVLAAGATVLAAGLIWTARSIAHAKKRHGRWWPQPTALPGRDSLFVRVTVCSILGWLVLMTYPAWLALSRNPYEDVTWLGWGLQDYRWFIGTYLVTIASVVALPPLFAKLFERDDRPVVVSVTQAKRSGLNAAAALLLGMAFSLALFAPPWNIELGSGQVGDHDVHLSQLQAIHEGATPYLGPASIQYGPGSQLFQYAYMVLSGKFSFAGYRESYAVLALIGFAIVAATYLGTLGLFYGTLAAFLALYISPFFMFGWNGPVFAAFFGWANPFRYMGAFVVVALLPWVLQATRGWRNTRALATGMLWGAFSWMSQENLAITLASAALFLTAAWALAWYSRRQVLGTVMNAAAGLLLFWLPVLTYYGLRHELGRFVEGYFLVPQFVAAGMSNTPWDTESNKGWNAAFFLTPWFFLGAAWIAMFDWRRRKFADAVGPDRRHLLGFVCVSLVCFTGALFRKDSSHFINVLIAVPAVVAALWSHAARPGEPILLRLFLALAVAAFVAVFPGSRQLTLFPSRHLSAAWTRVTNGPSPPSASAWSNDHGVAFRRAGDFVSSDYPIYEGAMPARAFFETMEEVRTRVGNRPAYVQSFPQVPPYLVYFFADLRPGPILFDPGTMVFHSGIEQRFLRHMEDHCREFDAVIGTDPTAREVQIFRACHDGVSETRNVVSGNPYYVWTSGNSSEAARQTDDHVGPSR